MRTKLNLGSSNRRVAERLAVSGIRPGIPSTIPMEWLDAGNWRLPSGKALAEFALQAGFLAPPLFKEVGFGSVERMAAAERFLDAERFPNEVSLESAAISSRARHFGKGSNR